ncbi:DUF3017 domain-containing protein [Demequina sp. NBRC 110055]|uniref:DUF3017 domain-containing protein n=1 Tax=Demequina sp. NBRC 110055 TaxID=1570344 RepID=UPI000A02E41C|nr:DUF3017 domain-containing protein [Demequina sp. NBRC 110055]
MTVEEGATGDERAADDQPPTGEQQVVRDNTTQTRRRTAALALVIVAACVAVGALVNAEAGTLLLGGVAFGGAAARMAWPAGTAFSVRRRAIDVTLMIAFGVALAYFGLTTPLA